MKLATVIWLNLCSDIYHRRRRLWFDLQSSLLLAQDIFKTVGRKKECQNERVKHLEVIYEQTIEGGEKLTELEFTTRVGALPR